MPEPLRPSKPPPGTSVNGGHPFAKGLAGLWPLNEGGGGILHNAAAPGRYRLTLAKNSSTAATPWGPSPALGVTPFWDTVAGNPGWYASGSLVSVKKNALSFGCWFRTSAATSPAASYLLFNGGPGANGWGLYHNDGAGNAGSLLSIILDGVTFAATTGFTIVADTTYFAVATCDGANAWRLFINGVLFSGPTTQAGTVTPTGGFGLAGASTGFNPWQGRLALPFVTERCLTAQEVRDLFQNPQAIFPPRDNPLRSRIAAAAAGGPTTWPAALLTAS
jgi:hypothetical protein